MIADPLARLRELLAADPFLPFEITLSDGLVLLVPDASHVHGVDPRARLVRIGAVACAPDDIASIEPIEIEGGA